ncbi:MAG: hypothetical protein ACXIU7_06085 [Roseinatronobacter sp.]
MSQDKATPIHRRAFLGAATTGAAATALGATIGAGGATPVFAQAGEERTRARYRKTEHVETFYRTNRYFVRGDN